MRASEWQYLCAVHDPPKSCCAIDYCCHTLDWAANVLTSQKHFPSRLTLGGDVPGGGQASVRQLTNIFRRVYRMFAHAWFQHRDVFWALENQEGVYVFYKTVCDLYQLIPEENYTVPPEAEGLVPDEEPPTQKEHGSQSEPNAATKRIGATEKGLLTAQAGDQVAQTTLSTGATTRRHKSTPSTGSFVTTIAEGDEEGEDKDVEQPLDTAALLSTVRRDPSSSPPKKPLPATDHVEVTTTEVAEIEPENTVPEAPETAVEKDAIGEDGTAREFNAEDAGKVKEKDDGPSEELLAPKADDGS